MKEIEKSAIKKAIEESEFGLKNDYKNGGPFGAVIVKNEEIISAAHNTVIESSDATAHAEINAIREASRKLNTHDLTGCILFTSSEPCPMCLSAIIWSNIKDVYYANTKNDVHNIGFRDDIIYEYLKGNNPALINLRHIKNDEALEVFNKFRNLKNKNIY